MKACIVGASGKLGKYMVQHALDRGHEVVGVCRDESASKLAAFEGRMTVVPGATDDPAVIKRAVKGCDGEDVYPWKLRALVGIGGRLARLARVFDIDDQVEACRRVSVTRFSQAT